MLEFHFSAVIWRCKINATATSEMSVLLAGGVQFMS